MRFPFSFFFFKKINPIFQADLLEIQDRLFTIGAELAADPDKTKLKRPNLYQSDINFLEDQIDNMLLNNNIPSKI